MQHGFGLWINLDFDTFVNIKPIATRNYVGSTRRQAITAGIYLGSCLTIPDTEKEQLVRVSISAKSVV
ncbi:MAG: hypothetical protein A2Y88_06360 [Chloroflexi bacterium RBG_13_48_10]|nr:MAG: hypothetical protein A2Y88_06360 [Chloroflexi bacterium RBG_13_48_10]